MPKRAKADDAEEDEISTPQKVRRTARKERVSAEEPTPEILAGRRRSSLKATPTKTNAFSETGRTPSSLRKVLFSTSAKPEELAAVEEETPIAIHNDRSARRKSAKALQKPAQDDASDDEEDEQEAAIAQEILDAEDSQDEARQEVVAAPEPTTDTPSKRARGRPKGSKNRERTPSPSPGDLPPHELYFFQNRPGANKTSANTLPANLLLNHEDHFTQIKAYKDPHESDIRRLKQLHHRAFDQWMFELDEGFSICLYGYGSKRDLAMEFVEHLHAQSAQKKPQIVVVNGYAPGLTIRDVLSTLASVILPKETKLPAQPNAALDLLFSHLSEKPPQMPINLVIHSLDHTNLRKPANQALLARLVSHSAIRFLATVDTPNFPLLWDTSLLKQFRWLYHDATAFQPYTAEIDVVEYVNALLGRSGRRLGGKDGVAYVLKSLPENARNLFRILVAEQLAAGIEAGDNMAALTEDDLDPEDILGAEDEEEAAAEQNTPSRRGRGKKAKTPKAPKIPRPTISVPEGVEYRTLYHKAVEEFVCSSELNFRTLLKEFHDHQIIESRKDAMGTERLLVPFRKKELEAVLEELV